MSLFKCSKCKCVENTALGNFWGEDGKKPLCSECDTGEWHGEFPKINAEEAGYYRDETGFIFAPDEVDTEKMVWKYNGTKIIGKA